MVRVSTRRNSLLHKEISLSFVVEGEDAKKIIAITSSEKSDEEENVDNIASCNIALTYFSLFFSYFGHFMTKKNQQLVDLIKNSLQEFNFKLVIN